MRRSLERLEILNRRARSDAFDLDAIDWSLQVDRNKAWEPDELGALSFVPSYQLLTPEQRRRCNQLHAIGICEQFVWFESELIRGIANVRRAHRLPEELDEALVHFTVEEAKHIQMFWRLLQKSEPAWYRSRAPRIFQVSRLQQWGMDRMVARPELLIGWVWLAIFVEERTLYLSRLHMTAAKRFPLQIDLLHTQVHSFHFKDEVRHYQLDQHLLSHIYDPQPRWKKRIAAFMFARFMRAYVAGRRSGTRILAQLGLEFPDSKEVLQRMAAELDGVPRNALYHSKHFSPAAAPHTFKLLAEYDEHDALWEYLPAAREAA